MAGAIWEDYSDGEVLDLVFEELGIDDCCNVSEIFIRIKAMKAGIKQRDGFIEELHHNLEEVYRKLEN
jgi:hypothetical protein